MVDQWEKDLSCAERCTQCDKKFDSRDQRVLSVYTNEPICIPCKKQEETRADYSDVSKKLIADCIQTTGKPYGDPGGYCFHHFCPYKC